MATGKPTDPWRDLDTDPAHRQQVIKAATDIAALADDMVRMMESDGSLKDIVTVFTRLLLQASVVKGGLTVSVLNKIVDITLVSLEEDTT